MAVEEPISTVLPVSLSPNPAKEKVDLMVTMLSEKFLQVNILDMLGHIVYTEKINGVQGENRVQIKTSALANAKYNVVVSGSNEMQTVKLSISK